MPAASAPAIPMVEHDVFGPLTSVKLGPSNQTIICNFSAGDGSYSPIVSLNTAVLNAVQVTGASGTFTLTVNGQTTAPIAIGADPSIVQAAITALPGIGAGNLMVSRLQSLRAGTCWGPGVIAHRGVGLNGWTVVCIRELFRP